MREEGVGKRAEKGLSGGVEGGGEGEQPINQGVCST